MRVLPVRDRKGHQAQQGLRVLLGLKVPRDLLAHRVRRGTKDQRGHKGRRGLLEHKDLKVPLDHKALRDLLGHKGSRAPPYRSTTPWLSVDPFPSRALGITPGPWFHPWLQ